MWRTRRPAVHIHRVPFEEEEAFLRVVCNAFGVDLPSIRTHFYDDPYYPANQRWGLWVEEGGHQRLVSVLTGVPLELYVGERTIPCVGVAGVGTLSSHRRRGYAGQLLSALVRALHEEGMPLAILQAFHHGFYRRFGWETVGTLGRVRVAPSQMTPFPSVGVRRAFPSDYPAVRHLHAQYRIPKTGALVRDDLRWDYLFWNFRNKWVCEQDGQVEGYLFYDFLEGGLILRVREILWSTERARYALLGWLAHNEERVRQVEFNGTIDELLQLRLNPLSTGHDDPEKPILQYEVLPGFMARVLDPFRLLSALLEGCPIPQEFQPFSLTVLDRLLGTQPPIALLARGEVITVAQGTMVEPSLTLGSETLARLALGAMEPRELFQRDKHGFPPELRPTLESLFPSRNPCLRPIDFF